MTPDDKQDLQVALGRLRESVLFYLKLDFALVAGVIALVTVFNLTPNAVIQAADAFEAFLTYIIGMIIYGIALEYLLTWTSTGGKVHLFRSRRKIGLVVFHYLYLMQVGVHVVMFLVIVRAFDVILLSLT